MKTKIINPVIPPDILKLYDKLVSCIPGIKRKGATMPYTSLNGNMFSFLDKNGALGLRLPEKLRNEFIKKYNTRLCEAHGTILKEYVLVPYELFTQTKVLKQYFDASFEYVGLLKPKKGK